MTAAQELFIEAEQGPLQAEFQRGQPRLPTMIMCHPHPLYGGSMHDAVLDSAAASAQSVGLGWLRFNFRGVGSSAGKHIPNATIPAETADLTAILNWLTDNTAHAQFITLGYSFGAYVICHCAEHPNVQRRILVAPPNAAMHCPINASTTPTDIIYGSADDYVNPTAFPTVGNISAHKLTAADHFFGGQYDALQATLEHILTADNLGKRD